MVALSLNCLCLSPYELPIRFKILKSKDVIGLFIIFRNIHLHTGLHKDVFSCKFASYVHHIYSITQDTFLIANQPHFLNRIINSVLTNEVFFCGSPLLIIRFQMPLYRGDNSHYFTREKASNFASILILLRGCNCGRELCNILNRKNPCLI